MPCAITLGRTLDCKDALGGLSKVYFISTYTAGLVAADGTTGTATVSATAGELNTITALPTMTVFEFDLRPDLSSFTINVQNDAATGVTLFEQTVSLVLQKFIDSDAELIHELSANRAQMFVLDNNDRCFFFGAVAGMDLNGGTLTSGASRSELSGQTLTFTGRESQAYFSLEASAGPATAGYPFDNVVTSVAAGSGVNQLDLTA